VSDSARAPVIAGLIVGIIFVFMVAAIPIYSAFPGRFPDPDYYSPLIQLKIIGLEDTYQAGEQIDFKVTQRAAGCVFPERIDVINVETANIVWQFNSTQANNLLFGCLSMADDPSRSQMTMNTQDEQPIIINDTGEYSLIAQHKHVKIEKHFTIVQ
jgi:hypothetical protein